MTEPIPSDIRILMVEPTGKGSHHRYALCLGGALTRLGVSVTLLTSARRSPLPFLPLLLPMRDSGCFRLPVLGGILRRVDRAVRLLINHLRLVKQIRAGHYHVVHLQVLNAVFLSAIAASCRRAQAKLVVTRHNVRSHDRNKQIWNRINQRCFRRNHQKVDAFVAHTDFHRRGLQAQGVARERIRVIAFAPHPESGRSLSAAREAGSILMAGGLRANKGLDNLLEALEIMDSDPALGGLSITVRIVGHAPRPGMVRRIRKVVEKLERIRLEHINRHLPDADFREYFARSQVLVLPYSGDFSSLSAVLLDGYLHDNELVVTDAGANGEVVREDATGEVVPAENPHALGMALINALNRGHDPARAANRKHALATRFNWERTARETRDLYLSLIS